MKNDNSNKQSNASKPMLANRLFKFRAWQKEAKSSLSANGQIGGNKCSTEKLFEYIR